MNGLVRIFRGREIDCPVVRKLSSGYLEDSLAPAPRSGIQRHLQNCSSCRAFVRSLAHTITLLGNLPRAGAPGSLKGAILARTRKDSDVEDTDGKSDAS